MRYTSTKLEDAIESSKGFFMTYNVKWGFFLFIFMLVVSKGNLTEYHIDELLNFQGFCMILNFFLFWVNVIF